MPGMAPLSGHRSPNTRTGKQLDVLACRGRVSRPCRARSTLSPSRHRMHRSERPITAFRAPLRSTSGASNAGPTIDWSICPPSQAPCAPKDGTGRGGGAARAPGRRDSVWGARHRTRRDFAGADLLQRCKPLSYNVLRPHGRRACFLPTGVPCAGCRHPAPHREPTRVGGSEMESGQCVQMVSFRGRGGRFAPPEVPRCRWWSLRCSRGP